MYTVFENLPLDEFGNRVPPITAEVAWGGAAGRRRQGRGGREHRLRGRGTGRIDPARNRAFLRTGFFGDRWCG